MNRLHNFRQQITRIPQQLSQGMQHVRQRSIQTLTAFGCRSIDTINHSDHNNTHSLPLPDTSRQHSSSSSTSSISQISYQDSTPHSYEASVDSSMRHNIERAIEVANTIPSDDDKSLALSNISKTLLANGNIHQAIEVARTLPDDYDKSIALLDISKTLSANGNIDQAIEVANTIPSEYPRNLALQDIHN